MDSISELEEKQKLFNFLSEFLEPAPTQSNPNIDSPACPGRFGQSNAAQSSPLSRKTSFNLKTQKIGLLTGTILKIAEKSKRIANPTGSVFLSPSQKTPPLIKTAIGKDLEWSKTKELPQ